MFPSGNENANELTQIEDDFVPFVAASAVEKFAGTFCCVCVWRLDL